MASREAVKSSPTRMFVPISVVTGRSVEVRAVTHGTPRNVVSSWMPPESVSTKRLCFISDRKSK